MSGTLEAHYPLDEDSGSIAYDYSGNGFNGTLNGGAGPSGTGTVTGPLGNSAYDFDGTDDNVVVPDRAELDITSGDITISFWMNSDVSTPSTPQDIVQKGYTETGGYFVYFDTNGDVSFGKQATVGTATTTNITVNTWHHIAAVDNNGTWYIYTDGVESDSISESGTFNNVGDLGIGEGTDGNFDGQIADVRIYSRALSPQEVQALYQAGERSEAVFGVTDSTAAAQSVSGGGGGGGGSSGGGGGGTTY